MTRRATHVAHPDPSLTVVEDTERTEAINVFRGLAWAGWMALPFWVAASIVWAVTR